MFKLAKGIAYEQQPTTQSEGLARNRKANGYQRKY